MKQRLWLTVIVFLALILRITSLKNFPAGFTADEAAQGYTAYSILKTGSDEWGVKFPLNPRSVGDFKPPLLTYLLIPSIAIFGLNEFSVRLPNAVLGSLAVLVVYLLTKELLKQRSALIDERISADFLPLLSALFLAVSPWHLSLSRAAFEMNLTSFFLPLGVLFLLKGFGNPKWFIFSAFLGGLNLFSYHSAKVVTPLLFLFLILWKRKEIFSVAKSNGKWCLLVSSAILLVLGLVMVDGFFRGAGTRASDIGIISGKYEQLADYKHFACSRGLPVPLGRVFYNKFLYSGEEFIRNYFSYTSFYFLFAQGAGEATYGMLPGNGLLYLIEFAFLIISFYFLLKEKSLSLMFLWFWVFVSPIPASMTRGVGYHASRVAVMMPAIQVLSAYGFVRLINLAGKRMFNLIFYGGVIIFLLSAIFFMERYYFFGPLQTSVKMNYGWREAVRVIKDSYPIERVIVSRSFSEPQAFIMFYLLLDPKAVQAQTGDWLRYQKEGKYFVDQIGTYTMGEYTFRNFSFPEDWQRNNTVLVGTAEDFLIQEKEIQIKKAKGEIKEEKIIEFPDGKIAIRIFSL